MKIADIPFVQYVGISSDCQLQPTQMIKNHIESIHAGAIYTLAESASGDYLLHRFPSLADKVIPLLRESKIKYKKQAFTDISAKARIEADDIERFEQQFSQKGHATIEVIVRMEDDTKQTICDAAFKWFISKK